MACTAGQSANAAMDGCVDCLRGSYQSMPFQDSCDDCPPDTTTRMNASTSPDQCEGTAAWCCALVALIYVFCCFWCTLCSHTIDVKSADVSDWCVLADFCPDGQQEEAGGCVVCPIGFYRNNAVYEFGPCEICPDPAFVTLTNGSTSEADCTIGNHIIVIVHSVLYMH